MQGRVQGSNLHSTCCPPSSADAETLRKSKPGLSSIEPTNDAELLHMAAACCASSTPLQVTCTAYASTTCWLQEEGA